MKKIFIKYINPIYSIIIQKKDLFLLFIYLLYDDLGSTPLSISQALILDCIYIISFCNFIFINNYSISVKIYIELGIYIII